MSKATLPGADRNPARLPGQTIGVGDSRTLISEPSRPAPRVRARGGWGAGFLMGILCFGVMIIAGWVALEWFIFPALDGTAGRSSAARIVQNRPAPDKPPQTGTLAPVPFRTGSAAAAPLPAMTATVPAGLTTPTVPAPDPAALVASTAQPGEAVSVQGGGISLHAGPSGTDPVVATRPKGAKLRVFARQGGWVQLGDNQPIGWGWGALVGSGTDAGQPATPVP